MQASGTKRGQHCTQERGNHRDGHDYECFFHVDRIGDRIKRIHLRIPDDNAPFMAKPLVRMAQPTVDIIDVRHQLPGN